MPRNGYRFDASVAGGANFAARAGSDAADLYLTNRSGQVALGGSAMASSFDGDNLGLIKPAASGAFLDISPSGTIAPSGYFDVPFCIDLVYKFPSLGVNETLGGWGFVGFGYGLYCGFYAIHSGSGLQFGTWNANESSWTPVDILVGQVNRTGWNRTQLNFNNAVNNTVEVRHWNTATTSNTGYTTASVDWNSSYLGGLWTPTYVSLAGEQNSGAVANAALIDDVIIQYGTTPTLARVDRTVAFGASPPAAAKGWWITKP